MATCFNNGNAVQIPKQASFMLGTPRVWPGQPAPPAPVVEQANDAKRQNCDASHLAGGAAAAGDTTEAEGQCLVSNVQWWHQQRQCGDCSVVPADNSCPHGTVLWWHIALQPAWRVHSYTVYPRLLLFFKPFSHDHFQISTKVESKVKWTWSTFHPLSTITTHLDLVCYKPWIIWKQISDFSFQLCFSIYF